jgi:hypothetical protein
MVWQGLTQDINFPQGPTNSLKCCTYVAKVACDVLEKGYSERYPGMSTGRYLSSNGSINT